MNWVSDFGKDHKLMFLNSDGENQSLCVWNWQLGLRYFNIYLQFSPSAEHVKFACNILPNIACHKALNITAHSIVFLIIFGFIYVPTIGSQRRIADMLGIQALENEASQSPIIRPVDNLVVVGRNELEGLVPTNHDEGNWAMLWEQIKTFSGDFWEFLLSMQRDFLIGTQCEKCFLIRL